MSNYRNSATDNTARYVPLEEAAETFSVSTKTLRRRIADGTITGYRVGRMIRVDVGEVTEALLRPITTVQTLSP